MLDDGYKINNLNTTFLRGTVASQLIKPFSQHPINCQGSLSTNDPRSSLNPKFQTKPNSLKATICFYELII